MFHAALLITALWLCQLDSAAADGTVITVPSALSSVACPCVTCHTFSTSSTPLPVNPVTKQSDQTCKSSPFWHFVICTGA